MGPLEYIMKEWEGAGVISNTIIIIIKSYNLTSALLLLTFSAKMYGCMDTVYVYILFTIPTPFLQQLYVQFCTYTSTIWADPC
jgi:hypothetical protein